MDSGNDIYRNCWCAYLLFCGQAKIQSAIFAANDDRTEIIMNYAGFWSRVGASIVDSILLTTIYNLLSWFVWPDSWKANQIFLFATMTLFTWLYFSILESSAKQGSLGKVVLGLKVVDYKNQRISFARATGRYFSKFISAAILMIGFIMVAFTAKKQGLHDMIAGTLVIKINYN